MKNAKFLFLFFIIPKLFISQEKYQDFGTWIKINLNFDINKKTSLINKTELRTFDNTRQVRQIYNQLSFNKELSKSINTSFAWRLKFMNEEYSTILEKYICSIWR